MNFRSKHAGRPVSPYVREGAVIGTGHSHRKGMDHRAFAFLLALAALLLLPGCYYDNEEELYPDTFCDTSAVTWSGTIEPMVQGNCAIPGCHVPGAQSPALTSYSAVKAIADEGKLLGVVVAGSPYFMPPSGKLPACDQNKVQTWLDAGAPQN